MKKYVGGVSAVEHNDVLVNINFVIQKYRVIATVFASCSIT